MATLYNSYLTGVEREMAIIIAESDAKLAKLNVLFEAVDATLEANMLAADAKVFAESGTYDDLTMLYKEAGEEAKKNKQGIFATIVQAIGSLFQKIADLINKHFGAKLDNVPEGNYEFTQDMVDEMNFFEKAWKFISTPFKTIITSLTSNSDTDLDTETLAKAWAQATAEVGVAAGTAGAVVAGVKNRAWIVEKVKYVRDQIQANVTAAIRKLSTTLKGLNFVKDVTNTDTETKDDADAKKPHVLDKVIEVGNWILKKIQELGNRIGVWLGKVADKLETSKNKLKEEADGGKPKKGEKPAEGEAPKKEEKPAEEKPAEEKPAEDEAPKKEEKPAEEKPAEEKPAEEKPAEEKPAEETPAEEKPAENDTSMRKHGKKARSTVGQKIVDSVEKGKKKVRSIFKKESASLDYDDIDDTFFYESTMSQEEYIELCELFDEL